MMGRSDFSLEAPQPNFSHFVPTLFSLSSPIPFTQSFSHYNLDRPTILSLSLTMALASANLQALIKATAALSCKDMFLLESMPLTFPQAAGFRLFGRIISPNPPSIVTVREFLLQAWKFATPFTVDILPGDRFLFTVSSEDLVVKIMDNGPWNVKGALMVVKPWPPELTINEVDLTLGASSRSSFAKSYCGECNQDRKIYWY
jgi:hypothetical protein